MNRRKALVSLGGALGAATSRKATAHQTSSSAPAKDVLPLEQFQPGSMLHTAETKVARAAFPLIDFHTHITHAGGLEGPGRIRFAASAEECLSVMDRKNICTMVNLTGGYGANLQEAIDKLQTAHPGRFLVFTEPS